MPKHLYDWEEVQRYFDEGHTSSECVRTFGMTYTAWTKAIKRGALRLPAAPFGDRRRKHDWIAVQAFYDTGASVRKCVQEFGFYLQAWDKAVKRGELRPRHNGMPIEQLLSSSRRARGHVKARLLHAGILKNECSSCGLTEWQGARVSMHLDHINGIHNDHRLENLRMLCPNCHSQTATYGGRNRPYRALLQEDGPDA